MILGKLLLPIATKEKTVSIKNEDNQTNNNVTNETAARDLPKEIQGWTSPKKFLRV